MLSILIPVYNYDAYPLVKKLHAQLQHSDFVYEIRVYDDCSTSPVLDNENINLIKGATLTVLKKNIGRSAIRNLLAKEAKFEKLLFLDAGTLPKSKDYIKDYLSINNYEVITGGMTNLEKPPKKPFKLRWLYTKLRERNISLHSSNFLISKTIIESNPFDESLLNYGYEDVLFFNTLLKNNIRIKSINNPVIHDAGDDANSFIKKTEYAITNLIHLVEVDKLSDNCSGIGLLYIKLKGAYLDKFVASVFKIVKPLLMKNFNSSHPLIFLYDFYRIGYFCMYKNKT